MLLIYLYSITDEADEEDEFDDNPELNEGSASPGNFSPSQPTAMNTKRNLHP